MMSILSQTRARCSWESCREWNQSQTQKMVSGFMCSWFSPLLETWDDVRRCFSHFWDGLKPPSPGSGGRFYFKVYKGWYILHMDFPNKTRHHFDPDSPLAHQCLSRSRQMPFAPSNDEGSKSRSFHPEGMERIWRGSSSSGPGWP